jgi:hypothetical protein
MCDHTYYTVLYVHMTFYLVLVSGIAIELYDSDWVRFFFSIYSSI